MRKNIKKIIASVCAITLSRGICLADGPDLEFLKYSVNKYISKYPNYAYDFWDLVERSQKIINYVFEKGYKLEDEILGFGYNGICWLAKDSKNVEVVLKFTYNSSMLGSSDNNFLGDEVVYETFKREGITFPPNSCQILDCIKITSSDKRCFDSCIVMNYVHGNTLETYINNKFNSSEIINWIRTGLKPILNIFHTNKLIHNDIKISNILVDATNATLLDYGQAYTHELSIRLRANDRCYTDKSWEYLENINLDGTEFLI